MEFTVYRSRSKRGKRWARAARAGYLSYDPLPSPGLSEPGRAVAIRLELASADGRATQVAVSVPRAGYQDLLLALLWSDETAFREALRVARRDLRERRQEEAEWEVENVLADARERLREERDAGEVAGRRSPAAPRAARRPGRRGGGRPPPAP